MLLYIPTIAVTHSQPLPNPTPRVCYLGCFGGSGAVSLPRSLLSELQSSASQTQAGLQSARSSEARAVPNIGRYSQILYDIPGCKIAKQSDINSSPPMTLGRFTPASTEADAVSLNSDLAGCSKYRQKRKLPNIPGVSYFDATKYSKLFKPLLV